MGLLSFIVEKIVKDELTTTPAEARAAEEAAAKAAADAAARADADKAAQQKQDQYTAQQTATKVEGDKSDVQVAVQAAVSEVKMHVYTVSPGAAPVSPGQLQEQGLQEVIARIDASSLSGLGSDVTMAEKETLKTFAKEQALASADFFVGDLGDLPSPSTPAGGGGGEPAKDNNKKKKSSRNAA